MATGRGRALASFMQGVEKLREAGSGSGSGSESRRDPTEKLQQAESGSESDRTRRGRRIAKHQSRAAAACQSQVRSTQNYLDRMPPEVLQKLLLHLDAASLFCISHVNKMFYELANSNYVWYRMYLREFETSAWKPRKTEEVTERMKSACIHERGQGYWRNVYFRKMSGYSEERWKLQLRRLDPYTGLSRDTVQVLRSLNVSWEITMTDKHGRETTLEQSHAYFSDSGVTLCWTKGSFPYLYKISSLQLHGVRRMPLGVSGVKSPYVAPDDRLPLDDVDPEYGLHGYSLHISLHNTMNIIMSGHFPQLFCRKGQIRNGFIKLTAISRKNLSQQSALSGKFILPWKSDFLGGSIEDCCMMNLTVFDEAQHPFWCVSVPVTMTLSDKGSVSYDLNGEDFYIKHQDMDGKVMLDLVWMKEHSQFFLVHLVVYISTSKVNEHFGREY
ncbi:F-box only protein 15 isoform X2 [Brienomyrus brachyistius]|uniref:F-box only protein 15 isoform X2 n=1 Tax=Brienomyrus brachyistius TaxID=42636 RepID=UPI0020B38883|nr:F-box only protein 15 isoform X2 [Brienomyrus brachyistius]